MSMNVIELTGTELVEGIAFSQESISWTELVNRFGVARANQIVQEMSQDGFWLDFGGSEIGATYMNTEYLMSGGSPAAISSTTETALELAQSTEMTASEVSLTPIGQGALSTGSSSAQTCGLLSLDVGVVGAALAPIAGVALGVGMYEASPDFWTTLSQKLLPFCYPGTTYIPSWLDVVESAVQPGSFISKVIIDKRIADTVIDFFQDYHHEELPEHQTTGTVYVSGWQRPSADLLNYVLSKFPTPIDIADSVYNDIINFFNTYDSYPFLFGITTMTSRFDGWSPLGIYALTGVTVGNCNLDINYSCVRLSTRGFRSTAGGTLIISETSINTAVNEPFLGEKYVEESYYELSTINADEVYDLPDGASEWEGDRASITPYSKDIIYISKDSNNDYEVVTYPGLEIALPEKPLPSIQTEEITKPENWPEEEPWPMEIDFPWPAPEGVEDWPETMPWPLPSTRPDWWPESIPYPSTFPLPIPSIDPQINPNPNENTDPTLATGYAIETAPGVEVAPSETVPEPAIDPSKPGTIPNVSVDGDPTDPNPPPVPSGESPLPVIPTIPVPFTSANDGLISVYHPTAAQLKAFASWLWVTYADPSIEKLWNNPFDGVIGLMEIYCTPTDIGAKNIRSGFLDSGVSSQTISRYTSIDCGSITIPEYYGDYFDYSPYSKCHIYLPFIGMVELNVDDIVGHAVNVTYYIDEYNGCCIAQITVAKSTEVAGEDIDYNVIMYQFSGNCAVELPLAGGTQSAIRAAMMQAAAYGLSSVIGGIASGASGNIGGAISQIGYGAANAVGSIVSAKSSVQHSGSFGSSYGALGIKTPYIVVTRPKEVIVPDYNRIYGYPAHQMVTIGACRGYLRVRDVHVISSTATDDEKKQIEELLKEGVYVTET